MPLPQGRGREEWGDVDGAKTSGWLCSQQQLARSASIRFARPNPTLDPTTHVTRNNNLK
jgi:hypothetical protein